MKNITISIVTILVLSSQSYAEGELSSLSVYENEKVEIKVEPLQKVIELKKYL